MTMARIPPSDRPLECGVEAQVSGCAVGSLNRGLSDDRLTSVASEFSPALSGTAPVAAQALPSASAAVPDVAASAASHARQDGLHMGGAALDAPSDSRSDAGRTAWSSQNVGAASDKSNHTPGPWGVREVEGVAGCSPPVPDPSASSALLSSHARSQESPDVGRSGGQVLSVGRGKGRFRGMGDDGGGGGSFPVDTDARETGKRFGSPGGTGHPARVRVSSFVLCLLLGLVGGLVWSPDTQHVVHRHNATGAVSGVKRGAPLQRTLVEERSAAGRGDERLSAGAGDGNGSQGSESDAAIGGAKVWEREREAQRFHPRSRLFGDVDPQRCVEFNGLTSTGSWTAQENAAAAAAAPTRSSSSGLSTSSRHRLRESSISPSSSASASWPLPPTSSVRPLLIIVTPTYVRPFQAMYLHRLANVLRQLPPPLLWLVVEIYPQSAETAALLRQTGLLLYRHIVARKNMTDIKDRGVHQRNAALQHIETHRLNGIVYFADDDNVYAPQLFDEIRKVRRFGTWPVAMLQQGKSRATIEGPVCDGASVVGWHTNEKSKQLRRFHVDMSGFAFNSTILWDPVTWRRPHDAPIRQLDTVKEGFQETTFIEQLVPDESHMEGLADGCSKVLVWHVHIEAPRIAPFPHWSSPWKPIQVIPAAVRQHPHQLKQRAS